MSAIPSTNVLIWLSVKPLIRVAFPAGAGFILVKTGVFPASGTRAASILVLNLTLPCLLFSKIVPSFNNDNISALGPIILTAFFYQLLSTLMGILARATTQTPRRFRFGIISSYAFSNWGDLPLAVLQSLTASAPFKGAEDEALGVAYVAVFILVNYLSMFPLQGLHCVKMDYQTPCRIDPALERRYEGGEFGGWRKWLNRVRRGKPMRWEMEDEEGKGRGKGKMVGKEEEEIDMGKAMEEVLKREREARAEPSSVDVDPDAITRLSTPSANAEQIAFPSLTPTPSLPTSSHSTHPKAYMRVLHSLKTFFLSLVSPPTISLLSALIIALIPTLKSLFVYTPESTFHPTAPDGQPPLAILYQTATFVGAASVPLGLTVLGASMAKMRIPRPVNRLPLASIGAMAAVKIVVLPVIGYFFVEGLVKHTGMVAADNAVLRFTLIYFSVVPTGTIQIAWSQILAPAGAENNSELLSAYILAQYLVFAFASVILTALSLNTIF